VLALLLFVLFRVTVPEINFPKLTTTQISDNQWFKLAKDTGIIYVSFAIPFVVLAIYAELLRTLGSWFTVALVLLFPPTSRNRFHFYNEWTLEPLALVLKKDQFDISDLVEKSGELSLKYRFKNKEQWENYQTNLNRLTKNSSIYLGDFLFFLVGWILLFHIFPQIVWVRANVSQFWHVAFALFGLACFAWFRVSHALAVMPGLQMLFVATMVRTDPDIASFVDSSEEHRQAVRSRLRELLNNEQKEIDSEPSLIRFVRYHLGLIDKREEKAEPRMQMKSRAGWPFGSLYERGLRFSWDENMHHEDHTDWIEGYLAYLYYRTLARIGSTGKRLLTLVRHIVTGTP